MAAHWFKFDALKLQQELTEAENARIQGRIQRGQGNSHQAEPQGSVARETGNFIGEEYSLKETRY